MVNATRSPIHRWFLTVGLFKGTIRVTSRYPSGRNSDATHRMLKYYLTFICGIDKQTRLVFANKKRMKEADTVGCLRRSTEIGVVHLYTRLKRTQGIVTAYSRLLRSSYFIMRYLDGLV